MDKLRFTQADDQKIERTGDNMNNLDKTLQKQPDRVDERSAALSAKLNKITAINNNLVGRWTMRKGDKDLIKIDDKANEDALRIIRKGENNNLSAIADYQTRYLKTLLHNVVLVGESNLIGAAKLHYDNAKMVLHEKLLRGLEEAILMIEDFERRAKARPKKSRQILIAAADKAYDRWQKDFEIHLDEFAALLEKTFSQ